jgi:glycine/D-amino acid oxidase-like deaminating enzyme
MKPGEFEYESYRVLQGRGHPLVRMDSGELARRHPRWNAAAFADGYYNPMGGWVQSGKVVDWLVRQAQDAGACLQEGARVQQLLRSADRVRGVLTDKGQRFEAQVGQPVLHFRVPDVPRFRPPEFPPWAADISTAGWYGFPALEDGTMKVANHGRGWRIDPGEAGEVPAEVVGRFRVFLAEALPELAGLPLMGGRLCFYCDTWDGDFFIDRVPGVDGLVVASGGSGHAFKFAPLLGELIADAVQGRGNPAGARFAWRTRGVLRREEARSLNDF